MSGTPQIRLDSSLGHRGGWSLPPFGSAVVLRCESASQAATLRRGEDIVASWADPLEALRWLDAEGRVAIEGHSRWVGFLSYDLGRMFERLPMRGVDDLCTPLFAFVACPDQPKVSEPFAWKEESARPAGTCGRMISTFSPDAYRSAVARVIDYIRAGDIFQVNLAQRFTVQTSISPELIHARLLRSAPASYGGLLDFGDFALVSNSPELFFAVAPLADGVRRIVTRPIKGTRQRSAGMEAELRHSIEDQAELNMIIDLEHNDLGRICRIGSVKVTEPRTIEAHPTVYHGVATVEGLLREDARFLDLLRAMFPGGSITGAPKIRAMEIIEELEPVWRGPYCGAIGYLDADGSMQFNIAIRTMILKDGLAHVPVGGGIVADSDPAAEYEETLVKARAMFAALGVSMDEMRSGQ